jgi:hypothetical protein
MSKTSRGGHTSYGEELSAIGWYFDHHRSRGIFIAEVEGGYLGKASPAEQAAETYADGLNFPREQLSKLKLRASMGTTIPEKAPVFCRAGYGAFMGAIGHLCDERAATNVSVLEVSDGFVVGYTLPTSERHREFLDAAGIDELLSGVDAQ